MNVKVVKIVSFQSWVSKDGSPKRTVEMNILDGEVTKTVRYYQDEKEALPTVGQEFPEYDIVTKTDNKGQQYLVLAKGSQKKGFGYQKKEVPPKHYLINTVLPSVLPGIMEGKYTSEEVMKELDKFVAWADKPVEVK